LEYATAEAHQLYIPLVGYVDFQWDIRGFGAAKKIEKKKLKDFFYN